jgi:hypothetical protein
MFEAMEVRRAVTEVIERASVDSVHDESIWRNEKEKNKF